MSTATIIVAQSRRHSLLETAVNVGVGYVVSVIASVAIFPVFGVRIPLTDNMAIGFCFTVISVIRSYLFRRCFNAWTARSGQ